MSQATVPTRVLAAKSGRFGAHHVVGRYTLCGIDAQAWAHPHDAAEVTCPWCRIRLEHGITEPTPLAKLPAEARKAIEAEVKKQKRAAERKAAKAGAQ